jgi:hypothetical protein
MDIGAIPFDVIDMRTWDTLGPPRRSADGGLSWTPLVPPEAMDNDEDMEFSPWTLEASDVRVGEHTIALDLNVATTAIEASTLERLSAFLSRLGEADRVFRAAIAADFETSSFARDALVAAMFHGLDHQYLAELFPGRDAPEKVTAKEFVAALSLVRIGYYDTSDYHRAGEHVVADYRFLVSQLIPCYYAPDTAPMYGGRYDITNQVVAVISALDGSVIRVTHES